MPASEVAVFEGFKKNNPQLARMLEARLYTNTSKGLVNRFTGHEKVVSESAVIISDVHLPTTNWALCQRVIEIGKKHDIRKLLIVGDLVNFDEISTHVKVKRAVPIDIEIETMQAVLREFGETFTDGIVLCMGNHEDRLLRLLGGLITYEQYIGIVIGAYGSIADATEVDSFTARIGEAKTSNVTFSPYHYMELWTKRKKWLLAHPRNYSRIPLRVANQLSLLHEMSVMTAHEHHLARGVSDNGKHEIINMGGLFDSDKMAYVMLAKSTMRRMHGGFVVVKDGFAHVLSADENMTNWNMWE